MQNRIQTTKKREGKPLTTPVLVSVYVVNAAILGLCIWRAVAEPTQWLLYTGLCVAAVGYTVYIVLMDRKNKKREAERGKKNKKNGN